MRPSANQRPTECRTDGRTTPTASALRSAIVGDLQEAACAYGIPGGAPVARNDDGRCKFLRRRRVISLSAAGVRRRLIGKLIVLYCARTW